MTRKSELLHIITTNLLEDLKPGIYTTDPIPKPKFSKSDGMIFCPYFSYPRNHLYVVINEFYDHLRCRGHLRQFTDHHFPSLCKRDFDKIYFILNNLDPDSLESYLGVPMGMLYLQLTV